MEAGIDLILADNKHNSSALFVQATLNDESKENHENPQLYKLECIIAVN